MCSPFKNTKLLFRQQLLQLFRFKQSVIITDKSIITIKQYPCRVAVLRVGHGGSEALHSSGTISQKLVFAIVEENGLARFGIQLKEVAIIFEELLQFLVVFDLLVLYFTNGAPCSIDFYKYGPWLVSQFLWQRFKSDCITFLAVANSHREKEY